MLEAAKLRARRKVSDMVRKAMRSRLSLTLIITMTRASFDGAPGYEGPP